MNLRLLSSDGVKPSVHPALRTALVASFAINYGELNWELEERRVKGPAKLHYTAMAGRLMAHVGR